MSIVFQFASRLACALARVGFSSLTRRIRVECFGTGIGDQLLGRRGTCSGARIIVDVSVVEINVFLRKAKSHSASGICRQLESSIMKRTAMH